MLATDQVESFVVFSVFFSLIHISLLYCLLYRTFYQESDRLRRQTLLIDSAVIVRLVLAYS